MGNNLSCRSRTADVEQPKISNSVALGRDEDGNRTINDYTVIAKLGKGTYGKVKLCMDEKNRPVAIKIMNKSLLKRMKQQSGLTALHNVQREIAILKRLKHPNIVRLFEVIDDPNNDKLFLVMEAIQNGPVIDIKGGKTEKTLSEDVSRKYLVDIINGLDYLHSQQIIHRDIKPENLLVDQNNTVKLVDFGVSSFVQSDDELMKDTMGTPAFLSPEACAGHEFSGKKTDVWAVGVTLYFFHYGILPFTSDSYGTIFQAIKNDELKFPDKPISPELKDLLQKLLEKDPDKRISIPEIKKHEWIVGNGTFQEVDEAKVNQHATEVSEKDINGAILEGMANLKGAEKMVFLVQMKRTARKFRQNSLRMRKSECESDPDSSLFSENDNIRTIGSENDNIRTIGSEIDTEDAEQGDTFNNGDE